MLSSLQRNIEEIQLLAPPRRLLKHFILVKKLNILCT